MFDNTLVELRNAWRDLRLARQKYKDVRRWENACVVSMTVAVPDNLCGGCHLVEKRELCSLYNSFQKCENQKCEAHDWNNAYVELQVAKHARNDAIRNLFCIKRR
ncbi:MAG: hypothetical protein J5714_04835 [Alphaproteobacteria bacterium]|nr:hypothetical protein [Alphaproteobacteria bacterium]